MHNAARRGGGLRPDMDEPQILRLVEPQSSRPPQISEAAPRPQRLAHPLSTTRGGRGYAWIRLGGGGGAGELHYMMVRPPHQIVIPGILRPDSPTPLQYRDTPLPAGDLRLRPGEDGS